jgi:hypothetical protein
VNPQQVLPGLEICLEPQALRQEEDFPVISSVLIFTFCLYANSQSLAVL